MKAIFVAPFLLAGVLAAREPLKDRIGHSDPAKFSGAQASRWNS
jgi:hypothetical protein